MTMMYALVALLSGATPQAADLKAADEADKKICKRIVPTGSMIPKRFCLTRTEWRSLNETTQKNASDTLDHRGTGMCDINCLP